MRTAISALLIVVGLYAAASAPRIERTSLVMPMRDGVRLSANLFRLAGAKGRLPVLLARTPYGKGTQPYAGYEMFLQNGYALVIQDVRGRGTSEGHFRFLNQESLDGEDSLAWIARQPWSDGRIGMIGGSYLGITQWQAALSGSPYLKAITPFVAGVDDYFDRFYSRGGALKLGHRLAWIAGNSRAAGFREPSFRNYVNAVPLRTADRVAAGRTVDFWQDAMNHPARDAFWKNESVLAKAARVRVPALIVGGWYDNYVESDVEAFDAVNEQVPARLIIGPWPHAVGERFTTIDFGPEAALPFRRLQLDWFDRYVKSEPPKSEAAIPPVRIFVMGANKWRDEHEWPLARTKYTPFYLSSHGAANGSAGDGTLAREPAPVSQADSFTFNPQNPVPTMGGAICCSSKTWPWGPMDQAKVETRKDVLVYSTEVLTHDMEVTGPVRAVVYVSTTAPDTDFTAKLVDVHADGRVINLCDGILRLRYRQSISTPLKATPGEVYRITIPCGVTSNVFKSGHRIRIEISSSNFPRFDRNPNTGTAVAEEKQWRTATQTVHHSKLHPSYVLLPVVP